MQDDLESSSSSEEDGGGDAERHTRDTENDENDDEPLINLLPRRAAASASPAYRWRKKNFTPPNSDFSGPVAEPPANMNVGTPLQYFRKFVTDGMLENIVENTNLYSVQKSDKSVNTSKKEVEQVLGMFLHMGLMKAASVRQYWECETSYPPVSDVMSRNRFQLLLTKLHFVNNLTVSDDDKKDKLWKIRPFLTEMRENCLSLTPDEHCAVDEMMCKYRGTTSQVRQYIKGKPHLWGFKIWGRAGPSGILYDFDVYQGGSGERTALGQGGDVIMKLTSTLPEHKNHKIYADNLFTSVPLG